MIGRNLLAIAVIAAFFLVAIVWAIEGCVVDCTMRPNTDAGGAWLAR